MNSRPKPAIILLTNEFNLTKNFASELRDSMIEMTFDAYTSEDILKILRKRANYCLNTNSFIIDDLAKIAKEVYQNPIGGDKVNIRYALNILSQAAILSQEKNKTITEVLDEAIGHVKIDNYSKLLRKYNRHILLLIKALCELKQSSSIGIYKFMNPDIEYYKIKEEFYKSLDNNYLKPISEVQFRRYIEQLVDENLLSRPHKASYCFLDDAGSIIEAISKIEKRG